VERPRLALADAALSRDALLIFIFMKRIQFQRRAREHVESRAHLSSVRQCTTTETLTACAHVGAVRRVRVYDDVDEVKAYA